MRLSIALAAVVLLSSARIDGQVQRASMQGCMARGRGADRGIETADDRVRGSAAQPDDHHLQVLRPRRGAVGRAAADSRRHSKATADELRAVWGPFVAEAGTYELTGADVVTMKPIASKSPAAMAPGAFIVYGFKQTGDTIWLTQQKNQSGPFTSPVTFKLVRVE